MSTYSQIRHRPLTNVQKASLGMLAREAWEVWEGREDFLAANAELSASKCFESWRRYEQGKAVGIQSLRSATQSNYLDLKAHFLTLKGDGGAAVKAKLRAEEEPRILAYHKLQQALQERDLAPEYAEAICRNQFRCAVSDASEKQLWNLVFTIRNRRKPIQKSAGPKYVQASLGSLSDNPF